MIEVIIDKSDPEGNGLGTTGSFEFGSRKIEFPFKFTSIARNNFSEYKHLQNEDITTPRDYLLYYGKKEYFSNYYSNQDTALENRNNLSKIVDKKMEQLSIDSNFNFIYMYVKPFLDRISEGVAKNIFDVLDSQYNHVLAIPIPSYFHDIDSIRNLINVFTKRKSYFGLERPLLGIIPHGLNDSQMRKLVDEYKKNGISMIAIDFNDSQPGRIKVRFIRDYLKEVFGNKYMLFGLNVRKNRSFNREIRPITDMITILCGLDGFNNRRFPPGGGKNWSELDKAEKRARIENIRFRMMDDYGEYSSQALRDEGFSFNEMNKTSILSGENYNTIHEISLTDKEKKELELKSKIHNWILTHKEVSGEIKKSITDNNLIEYLNEKDNVVNEVNDLIDLIE